VVLNCDPDDLLDAALVAAAAVDVDDQRRAAHVDLEVAFDALCLKSPPPIVRYSELPVCRTGTVPAIARTFGSAIGG